MSRRWTWLRAGALGRTAAIATLRCMGVMNGPMSPASGSGAAFSGRCRPAVCLQEGGRSAGTAWPQLPKQLPELRLLPEHPRFLQGTRQERLQRLRQPFPSTGQPSEPQQSGVGPHQQADQQARAALLALLPSLSLVVGGGLSGNRLAVPVLDQGGSINGGTASVPLPALNQSATASGSFYNWGAALLLRQPLYDGGRAGSAAVVAERQRSLLEAQEDQARHGIREEVSRAWSSMAATATSVSAAREAVVAGERSLRDARLRYRALVEPLTEVLLVQRDLQVARASLLAALTRQALDRALLERETGLEEEGPRPKEALADPARR